MTQTTQQNLARVETVKISVLPLAPRNQSWISRLLRSLRTNIAVWISELIALSSHGPERIR